MDEKILISMFNRHNGKCRLIYFPCYCAPQKVNKQTINNFKMRTNTNL